MTLLNKRLTDHILIRQGMDKLGFSQTCTVVLPDKPDKIEQTAAHLLSRFLKAGGLIVQIFTESQAPAGCRICLGRLDDCFAIRLAEQQGQLAIGCISDQDDGTQIRHVGRDILIAGSNSRGVLYGVYELEDYILGKTSSPLDIHVVPGYRKRMGAPGYYFNPAVNLVTAEFTEEKAEYLSRLRINEYLSGDTCYNMNLRYLVQSDVFPFMDPPDEDIRRKVKAIAEICSHYGIDYYHSVYEPTIISPEDVSKYPPGVIGRVRRPWGGDKDGLSFTLCVNSQLTQAHLCNMMKKFVREFTGVKGFHFYNMDFNTWLCTPELCERCALAVRNSPADIHNPWETQAQLVSLLADAAHEVRPDFKLNFFAAVHFHGGQLENLLQNAMIPSSSAGTAAIGILCFLMWKNQDPSFICPRRPLNPEAYRSMLIMSSIDWKAASRDFPIPFISVKISSVTSSGVLKT